MIADGPRGHGIIVNASSYLPFVFTYNPENVDTSKKINYVVAPNIGGSHKKRYFAGFDSKEVSFEITVRDSQGKLGVSPHIAFFEQLRNPDPGLLGQVTGVRTFGNENYPPPQVYFQFGVSLIPLVWDVLNIDIKASHFTNDQLKGHLDNQLTSIIGIPKLAVISITLALDEGHVLNKANQIAESVQYAMGSALSVTAEAKHRFGDTSFRKEAPWNKKV